MMTPSPTPQPNAKRYWGEEKNIDSIYSIYLKKICYTYNNDISLSAAHSQQPQNDLRDLLEDSQTSTASSSELAKLNGKSKKNSGSKNVLNWNNSETNCQSKQEESPRSRKNFFQKYRRRSCSMDKYSFERHHKGNCSSETQTPDAKSSKTTRHTSSTTKKSSSRLVDDITMCRDIVDGYATTKSNDGASRNGTTGNNKNKLDSCNSSLLKSMNDVSMQAPLQSLQWETRQIKILQAATLDHALKFILLINNSATKDHLRDSATSDPGSSMGNSTLDEERNNVAHIIHVFFCTYRIYTTPYELMLKLMDYSDICRIEQYRFVMHYWMDNYPEDFETIVVFPQSNGRGSQTASEVLNSSSISAVQSINSFNNSINSYDSSTTTRTAATTDSENSAGVSDRDARSSSRSADSQSGGIEIINRRLSNLSIKTANDRNEKSGVPLIRELLRLCQDEYVRKKAIKLSEIQASTNSNVADSDSGRRTRQHSSHHNGSKNSAVLDLDSRYVAQQLTAIDLENFLSIRPYSLLEGTKSDKRIRSMIKNFNLLSRHVVVTILKSHNPNIVTAHWIAIAMNLRKIKNFSSLKAIIAGLTNESIYRLKQLIWNKLDRTSMANFKLMASIVDDVNNQIVLRQTQLVVEGTAKMSIEDDSFGTIPYLGTFLTDLNMIDARYSSYVLSPKDETSQLKLINFEKCAKQFEILTQVQLLQKNVLASLHALQRRNHFDEQATLNRLKMEFNQSTQMNLAKPAIPQVSRLFENWFYDENVASMTDKQCYEISISLEQKHVQK